MRRRVKGQGTITRHSSGMVRAQLSFGVRDSKRQRETRYFHDEVAAQAWIDDTNALLRRGDRLPSRLPLGEYLAAWLRREARDVAPQTAHDYRVVVASMPAWLTSIPLGRLDRDHVQAWLDGMTGVSPRTVQWKRNMLRAALNGALGTHLAVNPAALARPPRQHRPARVVVSAAQCAAILAACEERQEERDGEMVTVPAWRYRAAVAVAIGCGLRQGELRALTWADVEADRILVRGRIRRGVGFTPGTKAEDAERVVPLPGFARDALRTWKAVQDAERAGDVEPIDQLVAIFTTARGAIVDGTVLTHQFQARLRDAGLADIRWHDLRHATADVLAEAGVPATVARDYMRHASYTTTADHYTGSAWTALERAGAAVDAAVAR